jgi:hypothetical protein
MPELDCPVDDHQDAAAQALVDRGERLARHPGQQVEFGAAKDRGGAGNVPGGRRKP